MNYQKGIKLALITAVLSGIAVFFNKFAVKAVGDALIFTTLKNLGVGVVMIGVLGKRTVKKEIKWREIERKDWLKLGLIGIIGGSLPFYLFFKGLMMINPVNATLIHKTLVLWAGLGAVLILKEKVSWKQIGVLGLIFGSNLIIGGFEGFKWGIGEAMILGATVLWAVEQVIAKMVLRKVKTDIVVGARMIFGSCLLLLASLVTGKMDLVLKLNLMQWGLMLATVGLLVGYVMSWYRALKSAPVILVATVLSLGTIVTNILSGIFISHWLNLELIMQSILLIAGVWFFVSNAGKISVSYLRKKADEGSIEVR